MIPSEVALADARAEIARLNMLATVREERIWQLEQEAAFLHGHIGALENSAAVAASAAWERMVKTITDCPSLDIHGYIVAKSDLLEALRAEAVSPWNDDINTAPHDREIEGWSERHGRRIIEWDDDVPYPWSNAEGYHYPKHAFSHWRFLGPLPVGAADAK